MRVWSPIYEGDSIIHYGATVALPEAIYIDPAPAKPSFLAAVGAGVDRFFRWLEKGAERARYRQLENYLADSGDIFELERRIRRVERGYGATFDPYS